jgi:hypothetical protein
VGQEKDKKGVGDEREILSIVWPLRTRLLVNGEDDDETREFPAPAGSHNARMQQINAYTLTTVNEG